MKATLKLSKLMAILFVIAMLCQSTSETAFAAEANNTKTANTIADKIIEKTEEKTKTAKQEEETKKKTTVTRVSSSLTVHKTAKTATKTTTKAKGYSSEDLKLLSAIIYTEAGDQPYVGKLLVGSVVNNRKKSSKFPNTIRGVIYQPYQFGPARNGTLVKALREYESGRFTSSHEKESIRAAKAILSGTDTATYGGKKIDLNKYLFFSRRISGYTLQIGSHQFK